MTFVNGFLLAGTLLIAAPIVLHLIMRQQPRPLEFPALRFIQQRKEANRRRLKLRHLILLALRCLTIALLAITLARPKVISSTFLPGGDDPLAAALVFDTSPRMQYRHDNVTRLEAAQQLALALLPQLPRDSQLVTLDSSARRSDFDVDAGAARLRIERLTPTPRTRSWTETLDNAIDVVQRSDLPRKEIFLFTDLAQAPWTELAAGAWRQRVDAHPNVAFRLIDVGVENPMNMALDDVQLSAEVISRNNALDVSTALSHVGGGGPRTVELFLLDEQGAPQKRSEVIVDLDEGPAQFVDFKVGGLDVGVHHGFVAIRGQDGLPADDRRYFTVDVAAPWRVLLAAPAPPARYGDILEFALAPPELRQKGISRFECEIVEQTRLADLTLSSYDAIWLLDPRPLPPSVWQRLNGYVAGGGGLAIALGGNAGRLGQIDPSFNTSAAAELLPGEIVRQWRTTGNEVFLAPASQEHPLLAPFKQLGASVPWQAFPVDKYWEFGKLADNVNLVAPFSNGAPAILERPLGQGRVVTLTTPLTDLPADRGAWNYLLTGPDAWPGFILVNELARYLVGSVNERFNFHVAQQADVALPSPDALEFAWLTTPPPAEDRIKIAPNQPGNRVVVTATDQPGVYRLEAGGERGLRRGFSVNLPAAATHLERLSPPTRAQLVEPPNVSLARDEQQMQDLLAGFGAGSAPVELYPWLLLIVVGVIAAEQLVSALFYRIEAPQRLLAAANVKARLSKGSS